MVLSPRTRLRALFALGDALAGRSGRAAATGWPAVVDLAEEHGVAPALWSALGASGVLPDEVASTLRRGHRSNAGRSMVMRRELTEVVAALRQRGVEVLLLKGAAYLAADVFDDIGIRQMSDLDIAIHPADVDLAHDAMTGVGYAFAPRPFGLEHHDRMYVSPSAVAPVELHVAIGTPAVVAALPSLDVWSRSHEIAGARVPSVEDALVHNVLHAQVQDREHAYLGVPLRQLHTFVLAARAWHATVDWSTVEGRLRAAGHAAHWVGHVHLAGRIFGADALPAVDVEPAARLRTMACLASFSLGWPTDVARNLGYALDRDYLEARYGTVSSTGRLAMLRARHLTGVLRRHGSEVLADVSARRR